MLAGVSTACLYPKLLEEALYDLAVNGITHTEIFINTDSELNRAYLGELRRTLDHFEVTCRAVHPYTGPMEPMMLFSGYKRRIGDMLEYYKKYFQAMNILGAEYFVFHGSKKIMNTEPSLYFESFSRLCETAESFGVYAAQENVSYCTSSSLAFLKKMARELGSRARFVIDTKQAVRSGENSFEMIKELKEKVVHIHISDHGEKGDCLKIGSGRFDIKRFLSLVYEHSPQCSVILELYRSNFGGISELADSYGTLGSIIKNIEGKVNRA